MTRQSINGCDLWIEDSGGTGVPILFLHGLLWSTRQFDSQIQVLRPHFRCVAYDHRGQGQSAVPPERAITIEQCYQDAVAVIETLRIGPCHVVGLSMGGFVGMRLAARRPDLVRTLVLLETSADAEPGENMSRYRRLNFMARWFGLRTVADKVMPLMFGKTFLHSAARAEERHVWRTHLINNRRDIWRAVNGVIEREPVTNELEKIRTPTLVLVGEEDVATVPAKAQAIVAAVRGARLMRIPNAGHTSTIEEPEYVNEVLTTWYGAPAPAQDHRTS